MSKQKYYPVGAEIYTKEFGLLQVCVDERYGCMDCALNVDHNPWKPLCSRMQCTANARRDGRGVHFKRIMAHSEKSPVVTTKLDPTGTSLDPEHRSNDMLDVMAYALAATNPTKVAWRALVESKGLGRF